MLCRIPARHKLRLMIPLITPEYKHGACRLACFSVLLLAGMELLAVTADFTGVVIAVADGDTVTIRTDGRKVRVRLNEIDAPERAQEWGNHSRKALTDLVLHHRVQVRVAGVDDYGRTLGRLYLNSTVTGQDIDINTEMV
ncbi:MAG: micrococcal nuclease, partial [Gammaproteobacteria bacterium]|nr:micrococcal nuclease [Gammaproteobacteria bacterium]